MIDDYPISYLSSARDLGRQSPPLAPESDPLVMGDPDYDLTGVKPAQTVAPLPATGDEVREIGALLSVEPVVGRGAVKTLLQDQHSPRLIHLATHGLHLAVPEPPEPSDYYPVIRFVEVPGEGTFVTHAEGPQAGAGTQVAGLPGADADPLLRSAVALAGFNTWAAGGDLPPDAGNGLLTADDVCALDLRATRLVVLSACDTGLGDRSGTEGVLGLRWAMAVAGARTVVTSLWQVPDRATRELMVAFYERLLEGEPVAAALRSAQKEMKRRNPDPWFWGAFVVHGDPATTIR
jgi:CHAT domain-containing protein